MALKRNQTYPGHTVSWRFADPEAATQVAIAIPAPRQDRFTVIAYNTSSKPQRASMTGWNVAPGQWRITQGADRDGDGKLDSNAKTQEVAFEKALPSTSTSPQAAPPSCSSNASQKAAQSNYARTWVLVMAMCA